MRQLDFHGQRDGVSVELFGVGLYPAQEIRG